MTVLEAINGHAVHEFDAHVRGLLAREGLTILQFCKKIFGVDETGKPKNSASIYMTLRGKQRLTPAAAERWAAALHVTPTSLLKVNEPVADLLPKIGQKGGPKKKKDTASQKLGRVSQVPVADSPTPVSEKRLGVGASERFSLVVNGDGTASVHLNVDDLPLETALKIIQALELPKLITGPGGRLAIAHDRRPKPQET
jgi:hypothetical protein